MKNLTMKEIAKLSNVSQPTVSRVINKNPNVNPEMRKRVEEVIKKYDFVPNKTAQSLKNNRSYLIGINLPEINNPYYTDLLDKLEEQAKSKGYNLILHSSRYDCDVEFKNFENFIARQVEGVIYVPTMYSDNFKLAELRVPTVALAQNVEPFFSIAISHIKAGEMVAQHFLENDHNSFCYIGFKGDDKLIGFQKYLEEQGHNPCSISLIMIDSLEIDMQAIQETIEANLETSEYTAIFCSNDVLAFECYKILIDRGIKLASDVALVGFDDTYLARSAGISSIYQPLEEMANIGFNKLLEIIDGKSTLESKHLTPFLKVRSSSEHKKKP